LARLNEHQKIIYEILQKKRKMPSGQLYRDYRKAVKKPVVARAYRNYLER
jgi:hypothetical protein